MLTEVKIQPAAPRSMVFEIDGLEGGCCQTAPGTVTGSTNRQRRLAGGLQHGANIASY